MTIMKGIVPPDPETNVSQERFAVVYTKRQSRRRFPAGCVQIMASEEEAIADADDENDYYPAHVAGPSKSSEGQYIYYLVRWL
ncbi:MAG: hypothetical protein BMS9Abin25_0617 [Gammaproteobacteria bacterium]|nr:MAG: hypothetical protein BMS9Abin25_0617 [Gammaproteobacteria bacterium]